jgi:3-dehydroquinate synthase
VGEPLTVRSRLWDYPVRFATDAAAAVAAAAQVPGVLVIDQIVLDTLGAAGWEPARVIPLAATEETKTLAGSGELLARLVDTGFRRDHRLVVVGGGIVQDVASFAASILYRGVSWTFFPTTLLAQCDSCIGGKTSINHAGAKNVIGNFHPPREVVIGATFLSSLSEDAIRSGIGEMLHYFVYADSPFLARTAREHERLLQDRATLVPFIEESLRIKQLVIEQDEFERGERQKFNYGHTFGHALEAATHYALPHGLAVTVGMDLANFVSREIGLMPSETFTALHAVLRTNFPRYDWGTLDLREYAALLARDKKNSSTHVRCILAEGPGRLRVYPMRLREDGLDQLVQAYFTSELPVV